MASPDGTRGERWWCWLHYGKGKCPGRPKHPRAPRRQGTCMDCWDRLVDAIKKEKKRDD